MTTPDQPSVQVALAAVKAAVGAVGKTGRNTQQNYNFRGVDAVVNAAAPHLNEHGVIPAPHVKGLTDERYETKNGAKMRNVTVEVEYVFTGPAGDSLTARVYGEAADSGDKAVAKAMSVAYRIALLQVLNLPTDEPDPDSESHERAAPARQEGPDWSALGWKDEDEHNEAKAEVRLKARGLSDESKEALSAWAESTGLIKGAMPKADVEEWGRQVDALAAGDGPSQEGQ